MLQKYSDCIKTISKLVIKQSDTNFVKSIIQSMANIFKFKTFAIIQIVKQ